ncbi:uncharacterized protein F5147DRAFT_656941 [Suillus discolor]|uniref:Uncharacterized protein n=1 Tax=Suillus discolor TaxID=1912936 RepID=A0A9P7EWU6_9AGAM|nr:uncharacterized protein F5147DRAFT_656941 [Suillus discolor]KAG2095295.1 hypothetical protein F5147DRAFT_656941 [Suillus discolor]
MKRGTLLEHAVSMTADVPMADLQFASRVLVTVNDSNTVRAPTTDILLPAFFILGRHSQLFSADGWGLHTFGLICERLGKLEQDVEYINCAITLLETAYEEKEDPIVECQFVIARTNVYFLKMQGHESQFLRLRSQYGPELAPFKMGDLQATMVTLQAALESAPDDRVLRGQVTILLTQTMWAIRTPEFRNLMAINTPAGMGILAEGDGLVDAALSEIPSLPVEQRHELDPRRRVGTSLHGDLLERSPTGSNFN